MQKLFYAFIATIMLMGVSFGQVKIKEIFVSSPTYPDNPSPLFEKSGVTFTNVSLDLTKFPEQNSLSKVSEVYSEYHKETKNGIVFIFHFLIKKDTKKVMKMEVWADNPKYINTTITQGRGRHCEDKPSDTGVIVCLINEFLSSISW